MAGLLRVWLHCQARSVSWWYILYHFEIILFIRKKRSTWHRLSCWHFFMVNTWSLRCSFRQLRLGMGATSSDLDRASQAQAYVEVEGVCFFFENYRDVWGSKFWILNSSNCMGNFSHFIFRLSITYKMKAKPRCFKPGSMDVTAPKWQQCVDKLCHVPLWCLPLRDQWSATCFGFLPLWCWWLRVIFDTCYACNQWIE